MLRSRAWHIWDIPTSSVCWTIHMWKCPCQPLHLPLCHAEEWDENCHFQKKMPCKVWIDGRGSSKNWTPLNVMHALSLTLRMLSQLQGGCDVMPLGIWEGGYSRHCANAQSVVSPFSHYIQLKSCEWQIVLYSMWWQKVQDQFLKIGAWKNSSRDSRLYHEWWQMTQFGNDHAQGCCILRWWSTSWTPSLRSSNNGQTLQGRI